MNINQAKKVFETIIWYGTLIIRDISIGVMAHMGGIILLEA